MNYDNLPLDMRIMLNGQLIPRDRIHSYYSNLYQNNVSFATPMNDTHYGVDITPYYPNLDERNKYIEI